ncbi:sugar kinase [Streptomyces sp. PKU-EA00015]|uniref:sugar kinase n=1 Tax=Streptomyces sp. PKU-EA00015 TaxID=2748326 RepID=UPI0015A0183B|nr:sugar kinase [Streptomyces sp. PKU-EA00015]NWF29681.1 sugar kinase [Streptomyces sp. PKU-EA00015]
MTASVQAPVDVVCLGESMVTFLPTREGRLADVPSFVRGIGGAESNVACALAAAGHRARWVGRVGADGFGDHLVEAIAAYGVDTSTVTRDAERPTGVYFRTAGDRATDEHEVVYYRAGSAASAMSPANVRGEDVWSGRLLHLSGITAALSPDCLALMRELTARRDGRPPVSFDVNHRPGLWRDPASGARVLLELARGADIVFVGEDEAEEAWGLRGADAIREALPEPSVLVVKRGAAGAVAFDRGVLPTPPPAPGGVGAVPRPGPGSARTMSSSSPGRPDAAPRNPALPGSPENARRPFRGPGPAPVRDLGTAHAATRRGRAGQGTAPRGDSITHVPAPAVRVVAATGAGDAFAAGFLGGSLRGLPVKDRLRQGHLYAAATLTVAGDLGAFPAAAHADRLVALDDDAWGRLHLGPGWTGADQEVRTP